MIEEVFGLEACVITEQNFLTYKELLKGMLTSQQIIATSRRHTLTIKQGEKFFRIWTFREKEKMQLF